MDIANIAFICHEANRAYCMTLGDLSQPEWMQAPQWQKDSALKGVEFHLHNLREGRKPSPSASHDSWLAQKRNEGWKFGPVKDVDKKEHPCFLPYEELPIEQRLKDYIFSAIVEAHFHASREVITA